MILRPLTANDSDNVAQWMVDHWGDVIVVAHGRVYHPQRLPGFVATQGEDWVGLLTYELAGDQCEIVTINSLLPGQGIGGVLIDAVKRAALHARCRRLWLITTNDNLHAIGFYQKRGFELVAIHRNAVTHARLLKPAIPLIGAHGIPLRDEIELEMQLEPQ